ncbi:CHASE2 domain-containing protein [Cylindrospermum sp. FACHB-282]|uniref:CHASE2 domain-containing protein n=1 Tax=Cylindrospermum sp. FACHB-282 TaxID=2692794 RepID=UPI0035CCE606
MSIKSEKFTNTTNKVKGIQPPPEIKQENLGFSDFVHDNDGVVRRHLLFMNQEAASLCSAPYALSTQLAFRYLWNQGITPRFTPKGDLQLGNTVFSSLKTRPGGYQIAANGQILLNYRSSKQIAEQVTLTQFLTGRVNPSAIKDRIVLVGVTAKGDFPDTWSTPYGAFLDEQMPGVLVQAQMVSQILSAVLDKRPLLRIWSPWIEVVWIWSWSLTGVLFVWYWRSFPKVALALGVSSGVLYLLCFSLLMRGTWVPYVPSALALLGTVGLMSIQNSKAEISKVIDTLRSKDTEIL